MTLSWLLILIVYIFLSVADNINDTVSSDQSLLCPSGSTPIIENINSGETGVDQQTDQYQYKASYNTISECYSVCIVNNLLPGCVSFTWTQATNVTQNCILYSYIIMNQSPNQNQISCQLPQVITTTTQQKDSSSSNGTIVIEMQTVIGCLLTLLCCFLIIIIGFLYKRKRRRQRKRAKTILIKNAMVIPISIGIYEEDPEDPDVDGYFQDLVGVEMDIDNVINLFGKHEKGLYYDIFPRTYLEQDWKSYKTEWKESELIDFLKEQADELEHSLRDKTNPNPYDALIVIISCHGIAKDYIITSDYKKIYKHAIHRIFSGLALIHFILPT